MAQLGERFWSKVNKSGPSDCWEWTAGKNKQGYGRYQTGYDNARLAHRLAYEERRGPIPEGLCVCHDCDNPICVNPAHLWVGTRAQNNKDMTEKKRRRGSTLKGEDCYQAKHTAEQVLAIRADYANGMKGKALAAKYGVDVRWANAVVYRMSWKHL